MKFLAIYCVVYSCFECKMLVLVCKLLQVEARTGYGGGYNERGVVEYRRREPSSEDEYDEFGRKKRKHKSDSQKPDEKVSFLIYFIIYN